MRLTVFLGQVRRGLATATAHATSTKTPLTMATTDCNVLDAFRLRIAQQVASLSNTSLDIVLPAIESSKQPELADFAIPTPRLKLPGNPAAAAKDLTSKFVVDEYISAASSAGPFMNFSINKTMLRQLTLTAVANRVEKYGCNDSCKGRHAIVEFSSPNIAKPFHVGHLRSTIIGSFVRNVMDANGWKTTAINYLGDWGKQYGLLAIGYGRYGSEEKLLADPIRHLFDVYVEINKAGKLDESVHDEARAYFKTMEEGNEEALKLWGRFRDLSIVKYTNTYGRLNINFDEYSGESQVGEEMQHALTKLRDSGLLIRDNDAEIVDLKNEKLGIVVVQKRDGTALYLTRDIGTIVERKKKYAFDSMIYVVASQQDLHFKQLFAIVEKLGYTWIKDVSHINFGMIKGMKSREGTVVFLDDLLDAAKEEAIKTMQKNEDKFAQIQDPEAVADCIGISAIFVQDMAARRIKDYDFNWERMLSFEGDTGPYLQYAHARLCSIERKSELTTIPPPVDQVDFSLLIEPEAHALILLVAQYPDIIRALPGGGYEPCNVVTYLFKLCRSVSSSLEILWVKNQPEEIKKARILLYWSVRMTLYNGLRILGLTPLERM